MPKWQRLLFRNWIFIRAEEYWHMSVKSLKGSLLKFFERKTFWKSPHFDRIFFPTNNQFRTIFFLFRIKSWNIFMVNGKFNSSPELFKRKSRNTIIVQPKQIQFEPILHLYNAANVLFRLWSNLWLCYKCYNCLKWHYHTWQGMKWL